jgi:hypothetical protein
MALLKKEEFVDEEPVEVGGGFVLKVFAIGLGIVTVVVGVPYLIYTLNN